jgi:hypothetical protein
LKDELNRYLATAYGIKVTDKAAYSSWLQSHQPFHWFVEFYRVVTTGGFNVIIGNPPYVEYGKVIGDYTLRGYTTRDCGNLYAFIVERSIRLANPTARTGLIIPVSAICTEGFLSLQNQLRQNSSALWISNYDTIPSSLFTGVVQRLTILVFKRGTNSVLYTTHYNKWLSEGRTTLFQCLQYAEASELGLPGSIPKIGPIIERSVIERLFKHQPTAKLMCSSSLSKNHFWYKRRWSYFLFFVDFMPKILDAKGHRREPSEFKQINIIPELDYRVLLSLFNSNIFYVFFTAFSDNRNVNLRELNQFRFSMPSNQIQSELVALAQKLMQSMQENSEMRVCSYKSIGTIQNQYFFQGQSKPIIDEIDTVLAAHYGFTAEELDFIMNYDIKYRLGRDAGNDEE